MDIAGGAAQPPAAAGPCGGRGLALEPPRAGRTAAARGSVAGLTRTPRPLAPPPAPPPEGGGGGVPHGLLCDWCGGAPLAVRRVFADRAVPVPAWPDTIRKRISVQPGMATGPAWRWAEREAGLGMHITPPTPSRDVRWRPIMSDLIVNTPFHSCNSSPTTSFHNVS